MSTKKESERSKLVQEKCQNLITQFLKDEDNKYCVDCDAKGPRWASWNLGVFLCIRCAGIHRNLGVHITRVKSVNLDTWTPEQVVSLQQMGNSRARAVYEAQLPDGFRRPQTDAALESFIRAKYEQKKYVAKEWVPSPPPKVDWDREIEEELEKQKRKKKALASGSSAILGTLSSPNVEKKAPTTAKPTPIPAPLPKPKSNAHSPKTGRISLEAANATAQSASPASNGGSSSNTLDLLGLSAPSATTTVSPAKDSSNGASSDDEFNNFFSANSQSKAKANGGGGPKQAMENGGKAEPKSLAQEEADFFNQSVPSEAEKAKLTKDSIMALYASLPPAASATVAPPSNAVPPAGAPTSNLNLLAGLGGSGGGFPAQFAQSTSAFPTQPGGNGGGGGHLGHFGGLGGSGPVVQAAGGGPGGQYGGQQMGHFGQMQSAAGAQPQFMNGAGGSFNHFNSNNHPNGSMGVASHHQPPTGGMNFFPAAAGMGGFQQSNSLPTATGGPMKGGFHMGPHPAQHPMLGGGGGGVPAMGGGNGAQMPFMGGATGLNGNSGGFMQAGGGQMSGPNGGAGGMMPPGQATNSVQQQFAGLNLGNVWQ